MALWLEHRNDKGELLECVRFIGGRTTVCIDADSDLELTVDEGRRLAQLSNHLPLDKREWVLRIDFLPPDCRG
jgi:hypothetical protein